MNSQAVWAVRIAFVLIAAYLATIALMAVMHPILATLVLLYPAWVSGRYLGAYWDAQDNGDDLP